MSNSLTRKVARRFLVQTGSNADRTFNIRVSDDSRMDYFTQKREKGQGIFNQRPKRTKSYQDYILEFYPEDNPQSKNLYSEEHFKDFPDDKIFGTIIAVTEDGRVVGDLFFGIERGNLLGSVEVKSNHRRKGIATAMYDWGEKLSGHRFVPELGHSSDAAAFWKDRKKRQSHASLLQDKNATKRIARRFLARHDYYKITPDMSIKDVARRYVMERDKPRGGGIHGYYSVKELWPFREYTWTRDTSRAGHARTEVDEYVDLPGPQKWDAIKKDMREHGWRTDEQPLRLFIGQEGNVKVGEGNHRLAIARELGMKKLPVKFMFRKRVRNGTRLIGPPDEEIY